ncbi:MAG TPA: ankyrin repeat domain-containing protein [Gammaproteobacteria bacterium]
MPRRGAAAAGLRATRSAAASQGAARIRATAARVRREIFCALLVLASLPSGGAFADTLPAPGTAPPLVEAAREQRIADALALIESGADVNAAAANGTTALHWAAHYGEVELARALLEAGAQADVVNDFGATPIAEAALVGSVPILEILLAAGVDANAANAEGQTPLMVVARAGNLDAAALLLEHGARPNAVESWGGQTALMWAAAQRHPEMVAMLLENGADPNMRGKERNWQRRVTAEPRKKDMHDGGFAALHYAAREGCVACIAPLLDAGADIDITDPDRTTPLNLAIYNGHFDFAKALIEAGADVNKWDFAGRTPLYHAVDLHTPPSNARNALLHGDETDAMDLIRLLLDRGADPNIQLKHRPQFRDAVFERGTDVMLSTGATPLLRAARAGDTEVVRLLLEHGAIAELPNQYGVTPFMAAAGVGFGIRATRGQDATEEDRIETLKVLLEAGADVNRRTVSFGRIPPPGKDNFLMHVRITHGNQRYIYSYVPPDGRAAIHGAARNGWNKVVQFLFDHGAKLKVAGRDGLTPMDLAAGRYEPEILVPPADPFPETMKLLEELCSRQAECGTF